MLDSATESDPENSKKKPDKLIGGGFTADSDTESDADQGEFTILYSPLPYPSPVHGVQHINSLYIYIYIYMQIDCIGVVLGL